MRIPIRPMARRPRPAVPRIVLPNRSAPSCRSSSSAEGVLDPDDAMFAAGQPLQGKHIETDQVGAPLGLAQQEEAGGADDSALLTRRHRGLRPAKIGANPLPHLDDRQYILIQADQIDFPGLAPYIACEHHETSRLQELRGQLLGCGTTLQTGFCGHVCQNARVGSRRHRRYPAGSSQLREKSQETAMSTSLVAEWDNFYVITGSSAAGLTGLTFVVIALAADSTGVKMNALRAYVTPTIVHFGTVLALAAYLSMPHQGVLSLSLGFGATGL